MLSSRDFKRIYRTQYQDLPFDLIIPALEEAVAYDRASGFFSVEGLLEIWPGLINFIKDGGCIRLITSVRLSEYSISLIKRGMSLREQDIVNDVLNEIENASIDYESCKKLDLIVNLIAAQRIDIQIAYMPNALFH